VSNNYSSDRVDFAAVKAASLRSLDSIIQRLLPGGKWEGEEWVVRNPTRNDNKPGSFKANRRTGVWSDFAYPADKGGDMIDLVMYLTRKSNLDAARELADMLGVAGSSDTASSGKTSDKARRVETVSPAESRIPPKEFPPRTPPDKDKKPFFVVAGEEGPKPRSDELRRHFYRRDGVPVQIKIMKKSGENRGSNAYRVTDTNGVSGWQFRKPEGFQKIPYFVPGADPFTAELGRTIFWVEGEKDVETVAALSGLAFTFGSTSDGTPDGCQQYVVGRNVVILADNDEPGRAHAEKKAELAAPVALSGVKIIHFRELDEKADVSDWAAIPGHTLVELMARVEKAEPWKPSVQTSDSKISRDKTIGDFQAFLPDHSYIYIPTRDRWPAVTVNSQLPLMPVLNKDGTRARKPDTKDEDGKTHLGEPLSMLASAWLDKNQAVEQMTWAPGEPMLIRDRLISEGGWFDHPGDSCFNLYRPPTIKQGDAMKAGRWLDHVKKVYPDDWEHIINWLAYRVQHPEIKINNNLVISGHPGVGKDTLLQPAVQAVGPWNCVEVSPENLFGAFNGYLKAVLLRVSEARDLGDVNKFQLYEKMKTMGAAPPDVIRVNEKHLKEHHVVNVVGIIITSNHKTDGIYLPADDRRHYVAWSDVVHSDFDSSPGAGDASKYFDSMYRWYEKEGGYEDIAAFLATADISGFNPKAPPLKTPAFWAIVQSNRPAEESEIMDALDRLNNPPAITIEYLLTAADPDLFAFLTDRKNRKAVSHRIIDAGYEIVRNDNAKDGQWMVSGTRKSIYADKNLSLPDQIKAARNLSLTAVKTDWGEKADRADKAQIDKLNERMGQG
jgi:Family of unknown function (DUF5906)